jgi:hypothetical protein
VSTICDHQPSESSEHQPRQCVLPAAAGAGGRPRDHATPRPAASGVDGHHLHPDDAWLRLSGCRSRLVQSSRAVVARVDHDGGGVLRRSVGGCHGSSRQAGDLQYRPGFAVHRPSLHRRAGFTSVVSRRGPALRTIRRATGRSPKPRMKRLSRRRRRSRNSEAENDALRAGAARSPALVNGHSLEPHPRAAQTKVIPVEPSRFDLGIRPRT